METSERTDLETVFKRQRAIQGVCGKTQPDVSEQRIQRMAYSTEEKVRALQKTISNPTGINRSQEGPNDWLDSPNATAEARLRRFDSEHPKTLSLTSKPKDSETLIQRKATPQSVPLFEESWEDPVW